MQKNIGKEKERGQGRSRKGKDVMITRKKIVVDLTFFVLPLYMKTNNF